MSTASQPVEHDQPESAFVSYKEFQEERRLRRASAARLKLLKSTLAESGIAVVAIEPRKDRKTVPMAALHSQRERCKRLHARIEELEAEVAQLRSQLAVAGL